MDRNEHLLMTNAPMPLSPSDLPWLVETTPLPETVVDSDLPGWERKVPDLKRRADLSGCFRDGDGRVDPSEVPDTVELLEQRDPLPDAFTVMDGLLLVTGEVKEVIEGLDPGRHQFVPVRVTDKDGTPIEKDWHVLLITHRQDALITERSDVRSSDPFGRGGTFLLAIGGPVALDLGKLDQSHLWRERRLQGGRTLFMSGKLQAALAERGLRFLPQHRTYPASSTP